MPLSRREIDALVVSIGPTEGIRKDSRDLTPAYSIDADPQGIRARVADAITGALAFGAQGANPPPTGHWLVPFWETAREEASRNRPVSSDTLYLLRRLLFAPLGYALRAARDSAVRADAIGLDVRRIQWTALVVAAGFAGVAGALFVFSKGSVAPDSLGVTRSVDALVMVLLGGIQTLAGPVVGSAAFTWLHDTVARNTDYWRALMGAIMLLLVLLFPQGLAGSAQWLGRRLARRGGGV